MRTADMWAIAILGAFVAANFTFQCLISANIIKANKITRIFHTDDESFIEFWAKTEEKGILRYIFKNVIYAIVVVSIVIILCKLSGRGWGQSQTLFETLSFGVLLGLVNSLVWISNEDRYFKLQAKGK